MNKFTKFAFVGAFLLGAFFTYPGRSQAALVLDGSENTGGNPYLEYYCPQYSSYSSCDNQVVGQRIWFNLDMDWGQAQQLSSVEARLMLGNLPPVGTFRAAAISAGPFGDGKVYYSENSYEIAEIPSVNYGTFVFEWDEGNRFDFQKENLRTIMFVFSDFNNIVFIDFKYDSSTDYFSYSGRFDVAPNIKLFDSSSGDIEEPPTNLTPVIVIPGIMGSAQKNDREWVLDPITHVYDNLVDTMKLNGYVIDESLFLFPYDWYESNVVTAHVLKSKIDMVKRICACDKVDIVAHSMGGLVARQYVQSDGYEHDVRKLIFLGTPHLGAPKAYITWEGGQLGFTPTDQVRETLLTTEARKNGYKSIYDYIQNKPIISVKELLPVYSYISESLLLRSYPDGYPVNNFLIGLNKHVKNLLDSGVVISNIVGNLRVPNTIEKIHVIKSVRLPLWQHGYPNDYDNKLTDRGFEIGKGDGTVPISSSTFVFESKIIDSEHVELPTKGAGDVLKYLGFEKIITLSKPKPLNAKMLVLRMLSPADMVIVAPDGKRLGKNFETGEEYNEIPDAFYSGFDTDDEYITIPDPIDGEYRIITQGTGEGGEYTIATALVSDGETITKDFTAYTALGLISDIDLTLEDGGIEVVAEDIIAPVIEVISPAELSYTRQGQLSILTRVTDEGSGVRETKVWFDDILMEDNASIDLFYRSLGIHMVRVESVDYMGNMSEVAVSFTIQATIQSTISDIERSYSLGWIDNAGIKNSLIKKFKEKKVNYKNITNELNAQRDKHVSEDAYKLLIEDINWLSI